MKSIFYCNDNYYAIFIDFFHSNDWFSLKEFSLNKKEVEDPFFTFNSKNYYLSNNFPNNEKYFYSCNFFPINFSNVGVNIMPFPLPINMAETYVIKKLQKKLLVFDVHNKNVDFLLNHFNNEIESVHISKIHELKLSNDKLTILCISNELLRFFSTYYFSFKGIVCISLGKRSDYFEKLRYLSITTLSELLFFIEEVQKEPSYFANINKNNCNLLNTESNIKYLEWLNEHF